MAVDAFFALRPGRASSAQTMALWLTRTGVPSGAGMPPRRTAQDNGFYDQKMAFYTDGEGVSGYLSRSAAWRHDLDRRCARAGCMPKIATEWGSAVWAFSPACPGTHGSTNQQGDGMAFTLTGFDGKVAVVTGAGRLRYRADGHRALAADLLSGR